MLVRLRFSCLFVVTAALISCTRGVTTDTPVAPTPVTPAVAKLTITPLGGGTMPIGGSAPMATSGGMPSNGTALGAFAEYTNAPGRYVEASWTSSDDSVLSVDGTTLVARKAGTATLTATFQGQSDTEEFVVEPGIAGRWAGSYEVSQCSGTSGSMQDVLCRPASTGRAGIAPVGAVLPFSMEITGSGADLVGVVSFGQIRGELRGQERGAGFFYLTGTIAGTGGAINIAHWDTRVLRDAMEGFVTYQVRIDGLQGVGQVGTKLVNMRRQ